MRHLCALFIGVVSFIVAVLPVAAKMPSDPLQSVMWKDLSQRYFGTSPVVFDDNVKVVVPSIVEDQSQVPVTVDARAMENVAKILVFADLNPIVKVLTLTPQNAKPYISFRMKVEQSTPVRAAVLTKEGVWHVGGILLDAAGGGCSAPAKGRQLADWSETVGQMQGKLWRALSGATRVRLRLRHPMDTGLALDNTPAYFVEHLDVRGSSGIPLARLEMFEPVSEDPTITLLVQLPRVDKGLKIEGRDNNGAVYRALISAGWKQSQVVGDH